MIKKHFLLIVSAIILQGCTVTYLAEPADELMPYTGQICVIEHPDVRPEFLIAYKSLLEEKEFIVKILPNNSPLDSCQITSDYIGNWSWDFTSYMATAEINIYKDGLLIGKASYEAPRGGWALTTEIYESTEVKIRGMLEKLFPKS